MRSPSLTFHFAAACLPTRAMRPTFSWPRILGLTPRTQEDESRRCAAARGRVIVVFRARLGIWPGDPGGTQDCRPGNGSTKGNFFHGWGSPAVSSKLGGRVMEVTYSRCAGLDVHKKTVVACVMTPESRVTKTFGTMTADLLELADWLLGHRVTHVAMESSGIYWRPIYNLLEGFDLKLLVVNAQHMKAVPGRKTDVKDAEWIAELLRHGLLRASFIPD